MDALRRYFETKNFRNHTHWRPSVKRTIRLNKSQLGLRPRPHWGRLRPRPLDAEASQSGRPLQYFLWSLPRSVSELPIGCTSDKLAAQLYFDIKPADTQ